MNIKYLLHHPTFLFYKFILKKYKHNSKLSLETLNELRLFCKHLQGNVVEMGCYKGGSGLLLADYSKQPTFLFDSFQGLPELTKEDTWEKKIKTSKEKYKADLQEVKKITQHNANISIIPGWFEDTLPKNIIKDIALLHLDADLYQPTLYCLRQLYDHIKPGGYILVDDYHLEGCRSALYDFFREKEINPFLQTYHKGKVYWRKP